MAHNAKAGGEIGANGEFYKGGQFVADSPNTVKGAHKYRGDRSKFRCVKVAYERETFRRGGFTNYGSKPIFDRITDDQISLANEFDAFLKYQWTTDWKAKTETLDVRLNLYVVEKYSDLTVNLAIKKAFFAYKSGKRVVSLDEFIKMIGGDDYFYCRYCKQYLEKHFPYYDESKWDELRKG